MSPKTTAEVAACTGFPTTGQATGVTGGWDRRITRRTLLKTGGSFAAGITLAGVASRSAFAEPIFAGSPFTLGVASGDPSPTGVVLWTRLAPDPLNGGGMPPQPVEVEWRVALDDRMSRIIKSGKTVATREWGHAVHVEVDGLSPHTWYWYQFRAGTEMSGIGRTRTFPAARTNIGRMRFGFVSCQHYEQGLYTAFDHMAAEDLDFAIHLGDYIYENAGGANRVRRHVGGELMTLDDYRNRYAQYKSDPALQAVHASFPWIVVWDDHEVDNNYAGFISENH